MKQVGFPEGFVLEPLCATHSRREFHCGVEAVNQWLWTRALQNQEKHLSVTKVLTSGKGAIAGYYSLATGQVDFSDLPAEVAKKLPKRSLPVAVLAWLGVDRTCQGRELGTRLLAQALRDCHEAGKTFAFVAVILDCLDERSKAFYQRWDFTELPGNPFRMFLSAATLKAMMDPAGA